MSCKASVQACLAPCLLKVFTYQDIAEVGDRLEDHGHHAMVWLLRMARDRGANVKVTDTTTQCGCPGVWGPNAPATIQKVADEPEAWTPENFPFVALRELTIKGVPVLGVTPMGVETYGKSRRVEKSLRGRGPDLPLPRNGCARPGSVIRIFRL